MKFASYKALCSVSVDITQCDGDIVVINDHSCSISLERAIPVRWCTRI